MNPPLYHSPTRRLALIAAVLATVGYALFLARYASVAAGGSDTSGYLNSARLLAAGRLQSELRIPPEFGAPLQLPRHHFIPLGFDALPGNPHLPPTYPIGLPLHLALAGKIFGWPLGTLIVELTLALGALWLCYALARQLGIDAALAAAGAVCLAACPVFLFTSLQPLSDTAATTWCLVAVGCALRARARSGWALAAGAATGMAVLIRVPNALIAPALVLLLLPGWRRLALAVAGGLPVAAWLGYYNHTLYGGALRSGYTGAIWEAFALAYAKPTLVHFGYWLAVLLPAALLVLPLAAAWRARSPALLALAVWFLGFIAVYSLYEFSGQAWWCLRFILPAVPALILMALLALNTLGPRARRATAVALATWAVLCSAYWTPRLHPLLMKDYEGLYPEVCQRVNEIVPPDALLVSQAATGALYHYTSHAVLRWDQISPQEFTRYATLCLAAGRPVYAVLFDGFEAEAPTRTPGRWQLAATIKNVRILRFEGHDANAAP